jgi:hypothetical protein
MLCHGNTACAQNTIGRGRAECSQAGNWKAVELGLLGARSRNTDFSDGCRLTQTRDISAFARGYTRLRSLQPYHVLYGGSVCLSHLYMCIPPMAGTKFSPQPRQTISLHQATPAMPSLDTKWALRRCSLQHLLWRLTSSLFCPVGAVAASQL